VLPQFWVLLIFYAYTIWRRTTQSLDVATPVWMELVFRDQSRPNPQGDRVPALPNFVGLHIHPLSQNYQIWRGNTCRKEHVSLGQPRLPSQESGVMAPNYWGSPVFMPTPFNEQRPNSIVTPKGRGMFSGGQPRRYNMYLHKCVARFVGDS